MRCLSSVLCPLLRALACLSSGDPQLPVASGFHLQFGGRRVGGEVLTKVGDACISVFMCHTSELKHWFAA